MNRQNFLGHLALALSIIIVAAFIGQMRRWESKRAHDHPSRPRPWRAVEEPGVKTVWGGNARGEALVRFRPHTTVEGIERRAALFNDRVEDRIEAIGGLVVIADEDGIDANERAAYLALPEVEYIEPNYEISLIEPEPAGEIELFNPLADVVSFNNGVPNDPRFGEQWALNNTGQRDGKHKADIDALKAWQSTRGSDKVVVAVLDSGVNYLHPDLVSNIWMRPDSIPSYRDEQLGAIEDERGYNAVENSGDPMDQNGHGTHCAGIIGAEGNNNEGIAGINWKVEIMPLKFMSAGGFGTTRDAVEAINYVIDRKKAGVNVRVISASWGSTQRSRALEDVIRRAGEEGILFVAASGNANANTDRVPHYPSSYNLPNVLSVAALNRNDELASFSNYGPKSVHVAAPGVEILSTWLGGEYKEASGTSMATPVISGVAALILAVDPDLSAEELRARLLESVDKLPALDGKVISGGRINAALALTGR